MAPRQLVDTIQRNYTIVMYNGITYSKSFQYKNSDGTPVDLTGKVVRITFKSVFDSDLVLTTDGAPSTLGSTFLFVDAATGTFRLQVSNEETDTATSGGGKWFIEIIDGDDVNLLWLDEVSVISI